MTLINYYIIIATEPTDHSIVDEVMHVIWAKGQEPKNYQHSPKSGLEKDVSLVKDFYKQDELKYHGHGSQRGVVSINFFSKLIIKKLPTHNINIIL